MTLHYDVVQGDAVGTTINTAEDVGTITFNNRSEKLVQLIIQAVSTGVMTSAEALLGTLQVTSDDMDFTGFEIDSALALGGAPATNIGIVQSFERTINLNRIAPPKAEINFDFEVQPPEPTSDVAVQIFAVYTDGEVPLDIIDALWKGYMPVIDDSKVCNDDELGDATEETMDQSADIIGKYNEVVGYNSTLIPDSLATDNEHVLAYYDLAKGGTLRNLNPMKIPAVAFNPELGTAVGNPVTHLPQEKPLYINKGNGKETIQPTFNIQATTSGAFASNISLLSRSGSRQVA